MAHVVCVRLQSLCVMCEYDQSFDPTHKLVSPRAQVLHLLLEEDLGIRDWRPEDYLELYGQYYRHRCNPSACKLLASFEASHARGRDLDRDVAAAAFINSCQRPPSMP